ncbi:uncharacterized protein LOC126085638 isoform X2 [Elephas maximus indicus]|uniref:uncharacterized protein LOC126085638 isoform X2 n=1 Tax=Elephas maximus indicus TaxID=99487 RepID=UPI0021168E6C|nr:uncharacterized protein LOC126085638 isoform X2 [Elephas maximus indicus]
MIYILMPESSLLAGCGVGGFCHLGQQQQQACSYWDSEWGRSHGGSDSGSALWPPVASHLLDRGAWILARMASHQQWRRPPRYPICVLSPAHCAVHGRGAPTPQRKARSAHLGFRRGRQQVGDHLGLGLRAQDPRRSLRAAQGPRASGPYANCGDQGFRGKAQTASLAPPSDHEAPLQRNEGAVHRLAWAGPAHHLRHRVPTPGACGPPPQRPFAGSCPLGEELRAGRPAFHRIRPGHPGPPSAVPDHHGPGLPSLPEEGVVRIPLQRLADLLELRGDAPGLGPRPTAAALSAVL